MTLPAEAMVTERPTMSMLICSARSQHRRRIAAVASSQMLSPAGRAVGTQDCEPVAGGLRGDVPEQRSEGTTHAFTYCVTAVVD